MIDYSNFPIPKRDLGIKLPTAKYRRHKQTVWEHQGRRCRKCRRAILNLSESHLHHPGGRGLGGGKRNDLRTVLLCVECHLEIHK